MKVSLYPLMAFLQDNNDKNQCFSQMVKMSLKVKGTET